MAAKMNFNGAKGCLSSRREFLKISAISAGALANGSLSNLPSAYARQIYPSAKIAFILPNKPGGGYDIFARAISPYLTKYLRALSPGATGGGVVVRNEERRGYSILFNAKPDGYTIGAMDTTPIIDNIIGVSEVDFTKFTFLLLGVSTTKVILAGKTGFNSWNEVVNAMKKEPVKMGVGFFARANHICGIIINEKMGAKFKLIPFRGTAECLGALMRGDIQVAIASEDSVKALIDAKEVKVLLSFSNKTEYPGAANIKELGFPEMIDEVSSHRFTIGTPGLAAGPKGLLLTALKKSMDDPDFIAWAKKADFPLKRVYGADAEKFFLKFAKFYNDMTPVLKKYLT